MVSGGYSHDDKSRKTAEYLQFPTVTEVERMYQQSEAEAAAQADKAKDSKSAPASASASQSQAPSEHNQKQRSKFDMLHMLRAQKWHLLPELLVSRVDGHAACIDGV